MSYDPLSEVNDRALAVTDSTIVQLKDLLNSEKFLDLPGCVPGEKDRLTNHLNTILNSLIAGISENPSKLWVMKQFVPTLETVSDEDTEAREHFADHLASIMDILEIQSSDGVLGFFL